MALSSTTVWEVQTSGSDENGGGFDAGVSVPGTDYTYGGGQATREWAAAGGDHTNDLVATDAVNSSLNSASYNFVTADEGNLIHISAGTNFTAGWYEILNTGANQATLDRNCTTGAVASVGSGILGGALATPGGLGKLLNDHGVLGMVAYMKSGTYALANANLNAIGGAIDLTTTMSGKDFYLEGYETSRGDLGAMPKIDCNGFAPAQVIKLTGTLGEPHKITNIHVDGDSQNINGIVGASRFYDHVVNCLVEDCDGTAAFTSVTATNCKASSCNAYGFSTGYAIHCHADTCTTGYYVCYIQAFCISSNNSADGYLMYDIAVNCIAYGNTSEGIRESRDGVMVNCISSENGTYDYYLKPFGTLYNCASYSTGSGRSILGIADVGAITLTADPFVNAAGGDFRLNNDPNGGALCRAAGLGIYGQTDLRTVGAIPRTNKRRQRMQVV